jgi:hypothetical protein
LARGRIGEVGRIDQEDFYSALLLDCFYGSNNLGHPGFVFSAVGAFFGRVLTTRWETQPPDFKQRRTLGALTGRSCWPRESRSPSPVQPASI